MQCSSSILPPREDTWAVPDEQAYTTAPASAVHSAPFPSPSDYAEHHPWQQFPTAHEDSAFTHIPAAFGPAVTAADEISLLPPVEEVARKGKLTHTFYSAQLLVSFKTKQVIHCWWSAAVANAHCSLCSRETRW